VIPNPTRTSPMAWPAALRAGAPAVAVDMIDSSLPLGPVLRTLWLGATLHFILEG
jgi:hypothetical protein